MIDFKVHVKLIVHKQVNNIWRQWHKVISLYEKSKIIKIEWEGGKYPNRKLDFVNDEK